jgi:hypothetical protein
MVFTFKLKYFYLAVLIFFIEMFIALFVKDEFVRPYVGDVLAVLFLYYLLRTFIETLHIKLAFLAFIILVGLEFIQYFKWISYLGIAKDSWVYIVLGKSFSWGDIVCYAFGLLLLFVIPQRLK